MQRLIDECGLTQEFELDSAGLYGGHAGEMPDNRMRIHARRRGLELTHRSRKVSESDFDDFDIIVAMDDSNFDGLRRLAPTPDDEKKIVRMADYFSLHPWMDCVPDPYYEGAEGFEKALDLIEDGCRTLLERIREKDK